MNTSKKLLVTLLLATLLAYTLSIIFEKPIATKPYSTLSTEVREGHVKRIHVNDTSLLVIGKEGPEYLVYYPGGICSNETIKQITAYSNVEILGQKAPERSLLSTVSNLLSLALTGAVLFFIIKQVRGGAKSHKLAQPSNIKFADIAGISDAQEDVEELVQFLKEPAKYAKVGAKIPRGLILAGPPGTGKTLLAKAIAGEAGVPFFAASGSDFDNMFVGSGANHIKSLFEAARKTAPSIIFIDEIDSLCGKRTNSPVNSHFAFQTINALLAEMDGFNTSTHPVIVIGATNRLDTLDQAVLRPGRFDRIVHVNLPDTKGRLAILKVHAAKLPLTDISILDTIAKGTPGFSGADLSNLLNEGAIYIARNNKEKIDLEALEYARDRVAFGKAKKEGSSILSQEEKEITAYHEAGHTLLQLHTAPEQLHKVTIIPRGQSLGAMHYFPEERFTSNLDTLHDRVKVLLAGRAAEELIFKRVTNGASSDLQRATEIVQKAIKEWGLLGRLSVTTADTMSEQEKLHITTQTENTLQEYYTETLNYLTKSRGKLEAVAKALIIKETLTASEVKAILQAPSN